MILLTTIIQRAGLKPTQVLNMTIKVAFFKGTKTGLAGIYNRGVRFVTKGKYSHAEIVFSDGMSASASFMDHGVRFKAIDYNVKNWDFLIIDDKFEAKAREWFKEHEGQAYDLIGNVHFLFPFVGDNRHKWSCAESVAAALDMPDPWRVHPNSLYGLVKDFYAVR
jgi:hypothetical protein